jgi:hypothetical protein
MGAAIHYTVRAKLIRKRKENGEFDFLEVQEDFYNDKPILAREAAFKYYQNYIDVLLEAKGLRYESHKQAREALESFHDPKTTSKFESNGVNSEMPDSWGNGIGVFLVVDESIEKFLYPSNLHMIHGIGQLWDGFASEESIMVSLEMEYEYYMHFKYNTGDYKTSIVFCNSDEWFEGYRDDEPGTYIILKTPFDWTGLDKPYWWGEPTEEDKEEQKQKQPTAKSRSFEEIISDGETNQVEFKPALIYNFSSKSGGIGIKAIIAKSICAFLNSNGGYLFIGINDEGKPQGLSFDFSLAGKKNPRDYFRLEFDEMIKHFLPVYIKDKITGEFIIVDGIEVFVVIVFPSKSNPIFMNGQFGKEFWVRWTVSTRQYVDIEEIANYCLEHWNKKV